MGLLKFLFLLLLLIPAAFVARLAGLPDLVVFVLSAGGLIPLAALIGTATEQLAYRLGPVYGGLLNATMGNAAELIITTLAVRRGLITLVKASITGSVIGNVLFGLGLALVVGGARHGRQRFAARRATTNAAMMILAVAGLSIPAVFAAGHANGEAVERLSLLLALVLLITYLAYLGYTLRNRELQRPDPPAAAAPPPQSGQPGRDRHDRQENEEDEENPVWPKGAREAPREAEHWGTGWALLVLAGATIGAAVTGELLVGSVETVTHEAGLSEFFVGVVVVPLIGNVPEQWSVLRMAWRDRLNVALAIAAGSSTQIALFVAPVMVGISLLFGHPLTLIFTPLEVTILGLGTAIFAYISLDGESNWLEGVQLLAVYATAALAFFLIPLPS
jgi:Ca2+:H+ antiporter